MGDIININDDEKICCLAFLVIVIVVIIIWGFMTDPVVTGVILLIIAIIGIFVIFMHKREKLKTLSNNKISKAKNIVDELYGNIQNIKYVEDKTIIQKIIEDYRRNPEFWKILRLYDEAVKRYKKGEFKNAIEICEKIEKSFGNFEKNIKSKYGLVKYKGFWVPIKKAIEFEEIDLGLYNNFQDMNPYKFEEFIGKLFEEMGYKIEVTRKTGDYGVDVVARKHAETIVIQVKRWRNPVPPKEVNALLGSMVNYRATKAIFVTTSSFTKNARQIADRNPELELWDMEKLRGKVREYMIKI